MLKGSRSFRRFAAAAITNLLGAVALTMSAQSLRAQTLAFTFTGTDTASFTADSSPSTMPNFNGLSFDFSLFPQSFNLDGNAYSNGEIFFLSFGQVSFNTGSIYTEKSFSFTDTIVSVGSDPFSPMFVTGSYTDGFGENLLIAPVSVVNGIPEPSTWTLSLLGLGGLGLLAYWKRKDEAGAAMIPA